MTIDEYLAEMKYAMTGVVNLLWQEWEAAKELNAEIVNLRLVAEDQYRRADFIASNAEDPDDVMMATGMQWDAYFGEDKEAFYKSKDLATLEEKLALKEFSFASLSGSLLQFAKQGLSTAYGSPVNWPPGREIGSQPLSTIVLQARNQAEHWEEGAPRPAIETCFKTLAADFDRQFSLYKERNLAFEVVKLLDWDSFESISRDLR